MSCVCVLVCVCVQEREQDANGSYRYTVVAKSTYGLDQHLRERAS